jgi:hypothetical protein
LALAAVLAGGASVYAIGQWIAWCSQKTLKVFGARVDPVTGWYAGPNKQEKVVLDLDLIAVQGRTSKSPPWPRHPTRPRHRQHPWRAA